MIDELISLLVEEQILLDVSTVFPLTTWDGSAVGPVAASLCIFDVCSRSDIMRAFQAGVRRRLCCNLLLQEDPTASIDWGLLEQLNGRLRLPSLDENGLFDTDADKPFPWLPKGAPSRFRFSPPPRDRHPQGTCPRPHLPRRSRGGSLLLGQRPRCSLYPRGLPRSQGQGSQGQGVQPAPPGTKAR